MVPLLPEQKSYASAPGACVSPPAAQLPPKTFLESCHVFLDWEVTVATKWNENPDPSHSALCERAEWPKERARNNRHELATSHRAQGSYRLGQNDFHARITAGIDYVSAASFSYHGARNTRPVST